MGQRGEACCASFVKHSVQTVCAAAQGTLRGSRLLTSVVSNASRQTGHSSCDAGLRSVILSKGMSAIITQRFAITVLLRGDMWL